MLLVTATHLWQLRSRERRPTTAGNILDLVLHSVYSGACGFFFWGGGRGQIYISVLMPDRARYISYGVSSNSALDAMLLGTMLCSQRKRRGGGILARIHF